MFHSVPLTDVVQAITDQELADWLGVDVADPLLSTFANIATGYAIEFLQSELVSRQREVVYQDWPFIGTCTAPSVSQSNSEMVLDVPLPYARVITVDEVLLSGEITTDYIVLESLPSKIRFDVVSFTNDGDTPAIKATYTAGFGLESDVPKPIKGGILMLASYLYEHRGACDVGEALSNSGAAMALQPYRTYGVIL